MAIRDLVKTAQKAVSNNSPAILTVVGVAGTVTTAYLAARASYKASEIINENEARSGTAGDSKERFKQRFNTTYKLYLPAVGAGAITVTAIVASNRVSTKRTAAMAAVYSISQRAYSELESRVVEEIGEKKFEGIKDKIAADNVKLPPESEIIATGNGTALFKDCMSGRFFYSDMESVRKAVNDVNKQVLANDEATLTAFWTNLGLRPTKISDMLGWVSMEKYLDVTYRTSTTDDERLPCHVLDYGVMPLHDFRFWRDHLGN